MNPGEERIDVRVGTVLFTDLVGFTEYTDAVGDSAALRVLENQSDMVDKVLAGVPGARLVKELGDGLMIWFDSAADGLACAATLLTTIAAARASGAFPLAVRMGIHQGEALARGTDLIGQTVNIGSRVSNLAGPGELLVSDSVLTACGDAGIEVTLQPIGPVVVKGVQEPIWLHRLVV